MKRRDMNILLADDDTEDQEILKEAILKLQPAASFITAANGREAYDYLKNCGISSLPALIILDFKMPLMSAVDILSRLDADDRYATVPKVVWSTSTLPQDIARCRQSGASEYFVKPRKLADLVAIARQMLAYTA